MANRFYTIANKKENRKTLKENNYTQQTSAIMNPNSKEQLIIDTTYKSFWVTCQEGLDDASKLIEEAHNQQITKLTNINQLCQQK